MIQNKIRPLNKTNCQSETFVAILDNIYPGEGERYFSFFNMSYSTYLTLGELVKGDGEIDPSVLIEHGQPRMWVIFFGAFEEDRLVGVGGCKYVPAGIKVRIKEKNRELYPSGSKQFFQGEFRNEDGLHLVTLPGYFEIGPTAIEEGSRGKGFFVLLHKERLGFLQKISKRFPVYPDNLLIGTTGPLLNELTILYQKTDKLQDFIPRFTEGEPLISDTIWNNLGHMREESVASGIFAQRMSLRQIGYKKTNGGPVWWGSLKEVRQQISYI